MKKNRTYKYLFHPMLALFFPSQTFLTFKALEPLNAYLQDTSIEGSDIGDRLLYVIIDPKVKDLNKNLDIIKQSNYYIDSYMIGDIDNSFIVIIFKCLGGKFFNEFLQSNYSKMYDLDDLHHYRAKFKTLLLSDKKELNFTKEYLVLTNSDKLREDILNDLRLDDPTLLGELDSAWVKSEEVFDSTDLNFLSTLKT